MKAVKLRVELPPPVEAVLAGLRCYEEVLTHQADYALEALAWYGESRRGMTLVARSPRRDPLVILVYAAPQGLVLGWYEGEVGNAPGPEAGHLAERTAFRLGDWEIREAVDTVLGWLDAYRETLDREAEPIPPPPVRAKPLNGKANGNGRVKARAKRAADPSPELSRALSFLRVPQEFPFEPGHVVASESDAPGVYTGKLLTVLTRLDRQAVKDIPPELILALNEPFSVECGKLNEYLWERIEERTPSHLTFAMRDGRLGFWAEE